MSDREKQEEKNKRIGWMVSVSVQLFLLVLFYFLIAWRAPFPPIPDYGIELGFSQSAGATPPTQTNTLVEEIPIEETEQTESETVEEVIQDQPAEVEELTKVVEESKTPIETTTESATKPVETETEPETETPPAEEVVENVSEETDPTENVEEEKEPEIDERAIYGSQGSSSGNEEGASLALSGWIWDFKPKPDDDSEETGKVVYKIVVDQDGYLVKIETVTSTVSPSVERKYREAVQKLTFSKTSDYKSASLSTGTLTFIIKTK